MQLRVLHGLPESFFCSSTSLSPLLYVIVAGVVANELSPPPTMKDKPDPGYLDDWELKSQKLPDSCTILPAKVSCPH